MISKEKVLKLKDYILVDVREQDEYQEHHIENAINIPMSKLGDLELIYEKLGHFDNNIVLYCQSGNRSKMAQSFLKSLGYKKVYNFGAIWNW